jgi:hypothetical protein
VISEAEYFGHKINHADCTPVRRANAGMLLHRVNTLLADAHDAGAYGWLTDPDTGTCLSGSRGGAGDGGFRLSTATTGRPGSSHKEGEGADVFDEGDSLDRWLDQFEGGNGGNSKLEQHGLYREHPDDTPGWCHLQTRAVKSGRRTFKP